MTKTSELSHLFRSLKAPAAARAVPGLARRAREEEWSHERFLEAVDSTIIRFRYRLSTSHPFGDSAWYGFASDEIFANLNDDDEGPLDGFEQNRARLGVGRRVFGRLRVEGGYEFQYARRRADPNEFRHVVFLEFSLSTGNRKGNEFISAPNPDEHSAAGDTTNEQ